MQQLPGHVRPVWLTNGGGSGTRLVTVSGGSCHPEPGRVILAASFHPALGEAPVCHETLTHFCIPATEKIVRTVAVYFFLVIGLRLAGKRELGQFTSLDFVVLITIANTVQNAIIGPENSLTGGLFGGAVLLIINDLVVRLTYRSKALERLLVGRDTVLYENGTMN